VTEERQRTIPFFDILDLISCAEDYGHTNSVCMTSLFEWAGPVSDEDIEAYVTNVLTDPQYGEEDAEDIKERLTELRDKYQPPSGDAA
jgi:hypothetical protein